MRRFLFAIALGTCLVASLGCKRPKVDAGPDAIRGSAEKGDMVAQFKLGIIYGTGEGVPKDYAEAAKWYRKAAEQSNALAQLHLGTMYAKGQGVPKDEAEAVKWWRKAAEAEKVNWYRKVYRKDYQTGHYTVFESFDNPKSLKEIKSEHDGRTDAQSRIGGAYYMGEGVPKDYAEAAKWYRKAAEDGEEIRQYDKQGGFKGPRREPGNTTAQVNLGVMYAKGQGVPKDEAEAVKWWRKAAEQGESQAQVNLGVMYFNGQGVPKDEAEGAKWFRKAAEQSNAHAQYRLGTMYTNGDGVPKDEAEGVKWFRKAAEQGDAEAQYSLGGAYRDGVGVPKDDVAAYKWILLAGATDEGARKAIPVIESRLTPDQRAEGQRLAREFKVVKESP